ncbi:adenylate/guanylate cyclase domain-containing protein [Flavobacterium sp. Sd200]|uniref:adenylate/guanylate cyclase domain-containing protein n=1 Tax=Flavobacterium sp. Sd200 TaxID=2692211 RepID=UPI001370B57A|nr:adenylate/guanylate cyclase domain-containing protein [Flavobacterium sp. Sd200]MXN89841.1 adenylate/guanylate cyclase domain-containing protein [Flavobacterium sp. Sd200]
MFSPKAKRNIIRLLPFGFMWGLFSSIYLFLEKGLLGDLKYYPASGNQYAFEKNIIAIPSLALLIGIITGILEIFYFSKRFNRESFTKKILYKSIIYLLLIVLFLVIVFIVTANNIPETITHVDFWMSIWIFFNDYSFLSVLLYITSIIVVTQFYTEVSESIGTVKLSNFFLGKYYKPVEEERIFMFLDMKSSTQIAEKLGHAKYFVMLQQYFYDLSDSVIEHSGEIYQYAGDEMILTWKLDKGLKNNNCVCCFFTMKESLLNKATSYKEKYGIVPSFKAGLHFGKVTTGEIGVLKKEIIFTGDVLNTTARIEGLCNQYNVDLLVSGLLIKKLDLDEHYKIISIGENELRGKEEKIELFTLV